MVNKQKGFTLIELLVVIAIIGILASVVLASLNTARGKGAFGKAQAQVNAARTAAENYYSSNGNYGAATATCTGMFVDTNSGMSQYTNTANYTGGATANTIYCGSSGTQYAIAVKYTGVTPTSYACVDSLGNAGATTTDISANVASNSAPKCW